MNKYSSVETVDTSNMSDQTKFRLNEIIKVEDYLNSKTQERNIMCKKLSKYIAAFDYIDKTWIVLSATSEGVSIISFVSVIRVPAGIQVQVFSVATAITKNC